MAINYYKLFKERESYWFSKIKPYIDQDDSILKIGNGFGFMTESIRDYNKNIDVFEITIHNKTINKKYIKLYDGFNLPFAKDSKDLTIFNLSLHHIKNNRLYLKQIANITKKRIIIIEETYDNIFQKIHLIWRDWYINRISDQPCSVFWKNYFKRSDIEKEFRGISFKIIHRETYKHHSYLKELIIFDKI